MTRAEAIANWQNGIEFISKATTVESPDPPDPPTKVTTYACWHTYLTARKSEFTAGSTLLKSVLMEYAFNPPTYSQIEAITDRASYWAALKQYGVDHITAHPEIFPDE